MTRRLTVAQATILFLKNQYIERDGAEQPYFAGCFGIFGHGNVAGLGQALQQNPDFRYYQCRNEQSMVHTAVAYAKVKNRLGAFVCTSSIGPGATNMITGAALATINRLPVLLLPGDIFATREPNPVLQQLESASTQDISVNDCFKPVSKYWDRINRPEQLIYSLPEVMRVLTSQSEMGAVTLSMPQDVQTHAYDFPEDLFKKRVWHVGRPRPDLATLKKAADWIKASKNPVIVLVVAPFIAMRVKHCTISQRKQAFRLAKHLPEKAPFATISLTALADWVRQVPNTRSILPMMPIW